MQQTPRFIKALRCVICGKEYTPSEIAFTCPLHDNEGIVDVCYDYAAISREFPRAVLEKSKDWSMWRYRPLLPLLPDTPAPPIPVGWTPLIASPRLAKLAGVAQVFLKDDSRQPTGSFKDRASALAVMKAGEAGMSIITTASTGNAAAALGGLCAAAGMSCVIFVPESAPKAKIAQLLAYGAKVYLVRGTYDDAFDLCMEVAGEYGWYNRNTAYNPYMAEGKKTAAYEICEQLDWKVPDCIFVGVGDGCIISGLHKGLKDLLALGWISRMPRLMGVQAEGSDFMYRVWREKADPLTYPPIRATTSADSIAAGLPRDRIKAYAAVVETRGAYVRVSDKQILDAIAILARNSGVFAEPAAAASLAGLLAAGAQGLVKETDSVALVITGSGLKDVPAAMKSCENAAITPITVEPRLSDVRRTADSLFKV
ncbi:MAG: threonine synthase [Deltaproteobacteria bacterium]|jgi:threonine synthase|nr:threonine synthase [Deltaproteobacteria bacterium]